LGSEGQRADGPVGGFKQAGDPFLCPSGINARTARPFAAFRTTPGKEARLVWIEMGFHYSIVRSPAR